MFRSAYIRGLFILNIAAVSTIAPVTIRYFINRKNKTLGQLRLEQKSDTWWLLGCLARVPTMPMGWR